MVAILYFLISWLLGLVLDYLSFKTDARAQRDKNKARLAEQFVIEELAAGSPGTRLSMVVKNTS